jgi:prepilin-type processing-associated H-X9-DG protein
MRSTFLALTLVLSAFPAVAQPPRAAPVVPKFEVPVQDTIDLSSPVLTLRSFAAAANRYDFAQAAQCVIGAKADDLEAVRELSAEFKKMQGQFAFNEPRWRIAGDRALGILYVKVSDKANQVQRPLTPERVLLRRTDGQWKIESNLAMLSEGDNKTVNQAPDAPPGFEPGLGMITVFATVMAHPEIIKGARDNAQNATCLNNLKQLAVAAHQLAEDIGRFDLTPPNDPKLAPAPAVLQANWQKALFPYVKNENAFVCPLIKQKFEIQTENDPKLKHEAQNLGVRAILPPEAYESYSFNADLESLKLAAIPDVALTVLIYDGKDGQLDFRHAGKANVAFADGHVKSVTPEEAKNLIWNPKGK